MTKEKSVCESKVFEELYSNHSKSLYNFIYYKCGNQDEAEDLVQEAFIKLWKNCAKIIFVKTKSFLYTVANNLFLNEVAHKKVVLKYNQRPTAGFTNEDPEFVLEEKEFMTKLQNAISDLTSRQREVFLMSRIDKKSYKEISELLGISVKAVEKRMHGALLTMREKISGKF
ncbi:sigma-70 family RNA polymerase sigma factor [Flavicella sp.]|uniref:RNA polymerase sigma factor n=1 Tax=Flavicella sp. TaxID=2957742 RepID=UPI00301B083C